MYLQQTLMIMILILSSSDDTYCYETSSPFADIVDSPGFVDKSMLIKYFLELKKSHLVITAPNHFGKSTNMDMLHRFLEIPMTADGHVDETKKEENERLFKENKDLQIGKVFSTVENSFMKHPVIYFDFKDINVASYDAFKDSITELIQNEYTRHEYMYAGASESEKELYDTGLFPEKNRVNESAGKLLSQMLFNYHGAPCVLLIDEYETPLVLTLLHKHLPGSSIADMVKFLGHFIGNLTEGNQYVTRSFSTGCTSIGSIYKEYASSLEIIHVFDDLNVTSYYGFPESELTRLAKKIGKEDKVNEIRFWYEGFRVKGSDESILCPGSVHAYFEIGQFYSYWANTLFPLQKAFDFNTEFCQTIENSIHETTLVNFDGKMDVSELVRLKNYLHYGKKNRLDEQLFNLMLQFLTETGVFTVRKDITDTKKEIAVTNHDTRQQLKKVLYSSRYLEEKFKFKNRDVDDYLKSLKQLKENKTQLFKEFLSKVNSLLHKYSVTDKNDMLLVLYFTVVNDKDGVRRVHWYYDTGYPVFDAPLMEGNEVQKETSTSKRTRKRYATLDMLLIDDENACFIVELRHEKESAFSALEQIFAKQLYKAFNAMPYKEMCLEKHKIYIGLYHNSKTNTTDLSYLFGDENVKNAVNLTMQAKM